MTEEQIEELQATNKSLAERVTQLESINISLVDQKKELKQKLEDGYNDEDMKKELDNYKQQLDLSESDKASIKDGYTKEMNTMHMMQQLRELGVETHNQDALNAVAELAMGGSEYRDGGFVYLDEDGTTRFNEASKNYSVIDKINELKDGDKNYLFKQPNGGGAGDTPKQVPNNKPTSDAERAADLKRRHQIA